MTSFAFITVAYQNCGSFDSDHGGHVQASTNTTNGDIVPIPKTKTASVIRSSRVLDSLVSCLSVVKPSDQAKREMNRNRGTISEEGLANSMTQPMAKSLVSVSAEVCNDLIQKERALSDSDRIIFRGVNFEAGGFDSSALTTVTKRISRSCWGRNPTSAEVDSIIADIQAQFSSGTDNRQNTLNKMIYLCTAMTASFATYEM